MTMTADEVQAAELAAYEQIRHDAHGAYEAFARLTTEPNAVDRTASIYWYMAECQAHLGNAELALHHAEAAGQSRETLFHWAVENHVHDADGMFGSGHGVLEPMQVARALMGAGDYEGAVSGLHPLLDHADEDHRPLIQWDLALCFAHLGRWAEVWQFVDSSGRTREEFNAELARQGVQGENSADTLWQAVGEAMQAHRWQHARDLCEELLQRTDAGHLTSQAALTAATALAQLGDWDLAYAHLPQANLTRDAFDEESRRAGLHPPLAA